MHIENRFSQERKRQGEKTIIHSHLYRQTWLACHLIRRIRRGRSTDIYLNFTLFSAPQMRVRSTLGSFAQRTSVKSHVHPSRRTKERTTYVVLANWSREIFSDIIISFLIKKLSRIIKVIKCLVTRA